MNLPISEGGEKLEEKRSFILYSSYMEQFNELSDEQAGKLIKAIFMYAEKKIIPEFDDGMVKMAFSFIKTFRSRKKRRQANPSKSSKCFFG